VYGYFLKDRLIAFSSELKCGDDLCAYYVGFDSKTNTHYSVYGRILIETINNAIQVKSNRVIFGRSVSEFKSNFGATPVKSYIFIGFKNMFLHYVFMFLLKQIVVASWVQRKPFKSHKCK